MNPPMKSPLLSFSTTAIVLTAITCLSIDFVLKKWNRLDGVIETDVHWYYAYLPSAFIYHDIAQEKSDYRFEGDYYLFWPILTPEGKKINKTTMGLAFMYAPFFFAGHGYAVLFDYPLNGFAEPYKVFLLLSAVFYLIIGMIFLIKTLRHYGFSDLHSGITVLLVGLGTNLLCYASQSAPQVHVYNFFLFSLFIYYTIVWHQSPKFKTSMVLGLLFGLISLTRPSNAVIILFFLLYEVSSPSDLWKRLALFKKELLPLVVFAFFTFLVWSPQFLYWKFITGKYLFYSYTQEKFFFDNPKIWEGLFGFRKGWLTYTPMMGFALAGIFLMKGALKKLRLPIIVFLMVNVYIIFSWWCWWYGGSYGQRPMIDSYPLLAIPLCAFVKYVSEKKKMFQLAFYSIFAFFIWLNIFQTFQFEYGSLHWEGMTKELYFKQFGRLSRIDGYDSYLKWPDCKKAMQGEER